MRDLIHDKERDKVLKGENPPTTTILVTFGLTPSGSDDPNPLFEISHPNPLKVGTVSHLINDLFDGTSGSHSSRSVPPEGVCEGYKNCSHGSTGGRTARIDLRWEVGGTCGVEFRPPSVERRAVRDLEEFPSPPKSKVNRPGGVYIRV